MGYSIGKHLACGVSLKTFGTFQSASPTESHHCHCCGLESSLGDKHTRRQRTETPESCPLDPRLIITRTVGPAVLTPRRSVLAEISTSQKVTPLQIVVVLFTRALFFRPNPNCKCFVNKVYFGLQRPRFGDF